MNWSAVRASGTRSSASASTISARPSLVDNANSRSMSSTPPRGSSLALMASIRRVAVRSMRLQRDGFVEGYGARLNPHRLGLGLLVFVEVMLDKTTSDVFERFARAVQTAPEVLECHMVAGGFDYLVKARLADMTAY